MCKKPTGFYKYEKIKEIVDKIIIETDKDLEKYNTIIDEIKESKICTQQLISIVSRLIQKIFSSDVGWHFCWKESVENTITASIDSMLFCMSDKFIKTRQSISPLSRPYSLISPLTNPCVITRF